MMYMMLVQADMKRRVLVGGTISTSNSQATVHLLVANWNLHINQTASSTTGITFGIEGNSGNTLQQWYVTIIIQMAHT